MGLRNRIEELCHSRLENDARLPDYWLWRHQMHPEAAISEPILLAIDQGTSSSRCIAFSVRGAIVALDQHPFEQIYPASGWVEHDPEVIWATTLSTAREVLKQVRAKQRQVAAIGVTNQRE